MIIFSRSALARKTELNLKLYGETLKIYPQVKFLGITFDSQLNFKKHFEGILDRCNTRYHRLRLLVNKKWGPSPATLIQIYKQCVRPIFEYGSVSTITFLIYVNDLPTPHHKQNSLSQFADDTAQWAFSRNVRIAAKLLQQDLLTLAMWCAK